MRGAAEARARRARRRAVLLRARARVLDRRAHAPLAPARDARGRPLHDRRAQVSGGSGWFSL